jgi:hypothetical protein
MAINFAQIISASGCETKAFDGVGLIHRNPVASAAGTNNLAQFALSSDTGTFVYLPGEAFGTFRSISWIDRAGKISQLRSADSDWSNPQFAPDGRKIALDISDGKQTDVWIYEWARIGVVVPGRQSMPGRGTDSEQVTVLQPYCLVRSICAAITRAWVIGSRPMEFQKLNMNKAIRSAWRALSGSVWA